MVESKGERKEKEKRKKENEKGRDIVVRVPRKMSEQEDEFVEKDGQLKKR